METLTMAVVLIGSLIIGLVIGLRIRGKMKQPKDSE